MELFVNLPAKSDEYIVAKSDSLDLISQSCAFCGKKISGMSLRSVDHSKNFCNIVCAKLYYDNFENISLDFNEYKQYYCNGLLNNVSKKLYEFTKQTIFQMLPLMKINKDCDKYASKKYYKKILLSNQN